MVNQGLQLVLDNGGVTWIKNILQKQLLQNRRQMFCLIMTTMALKNLTMHCHRGGNMDFISRL
jgi:hypothetical protein